MDDCPRPKKLLCTWHVDRAVTKELRKKIGDLQTEIEVYNMFPTVLEQTSETLFEESLRGFISRLSLSSNLPPSESILNRNGFPEKKNGHIALDSALVLIQICL